MGKSKKECKLKPIDIYIKEVHELAKKTEKNRKINTNKKEKLGK